MPRGKLSNVPELPLHFLPRPEELQPLKEKVLAETNQRVVVTGRTRRVGVQGMGGIGKTVLAVALARDEDVQRAFPDGIVWVRLGKEEPNLLARQAQVARTLTGKQIEFKDLQDGNAFLSDLLADKASLLILDDVWELSHAEAFNVLGQQSQLLITTRDSELISALGALEHRLDVLSERQALELLAELSGQAVEELPETAREVAQECGNLPLALAMVGAMVEGDPDLWSDLLETLRNAELEDIEHKFPDYPYPNLLRAIKVSVDALKPEEQECYLHFAVFPEDTPIPVEVLQTLWEPKELNSLKIKKIIKTLVKRSLAQKDSSDRLTLHDLQLDYVRKQFDDLTQLHKQLLEVYKRKTKEDLWHTLPNDGYDQGLAYALQSSNPQDKASLLTEIVDYLPQNLQEEALQKALAAARAIQADYNRVKALSALADKLPEVLPEALAAARAIQDDYNRAYALTYLADKLPEVLPEALAAARAIQDEYARADALRDLADKLSKIQPGKLFPLWQNTLHSLSLRTRRNFLQDIAALAPVICALGDQAAVAEVARAIQDVARWWP